MTNQEIINQLLNGYHLSDKELKQAQKLVDNLQKMIDARK